MVMQQNNTDIDWGAIGTALTAIGVAIGAGWTWLTNRPKIDKTIDNDPDITSINNLKEAMVLLQSENKRLVDENQRLWKRINEVEDYWQARYQRVMLRLNELDGKGTNGGEKK